MSTIELTERPNGVALDPLAVRQWVSVRRHGFPTRPGAYFFATRDGGVKVGLFTVQESIESLQRNGAPDVFAWMEVEMPEPPFQDGEFCPEGFVDIGFGLRGLDYSAKKANHGSTDTTDRRQYEQARPPTPDS